LLPLTRLCGKSLIREMKTLWVAHVASYISHYNFYYVDHSLNRWPAKGIRSHRPRKASAISRAQTLTEACKVERAYNKPSRWLAGKH